MSEAVAAPRGLRDRLQDLRSDRMLVNSVLLLTTTALMAAAGAVFWVVAARLHPPEVVGVAGSLVASADALALFAQLGLNIALVRTMQTSSRPAGDVLTAAAVVGTAGGTFALAFALLLPLTSPSIHGVLDSPLLVALFCVLVAATAVNVLSDNVFLAVDRVRSYLVLNGVLLGAAKLTLPFLLAGAGALGLYGSVGGAALLCGLASLWVLLRRLPGPRTFVPSVELRGARGFAGAGYVTYVLTVLPQMVLPLIVINALGTAEGAFFFVSVQVVALQNAVLLAVGSSMYAESERRPDQRTRAVARGGVTMAVAGVASAVVVVGVAPWLLAVFGPEYADQGSATLRVLALGVLGLGFNYWVAMRLRIAHHTRAMVVAQLVCTTAVLVLCSWAAPHGTVWTAAAWGGAQLAGGLVGLLISLTVAPLRDEAPADPTPAVEVP